VGASWGGEEKPFWVLSEVLADHPDQSLKDDEFVRRVNIKISFSGLRGGFYAVGWVNLRFGECEGLMLVSGDLTVYREGGKTGALLPVVNLPLGQTVYEKGSEQLAVLPLNKKTEFKVAEKSPIRWIDIDGDGVEELVYASACGNRFATHHFIYEYDHSPDWAKFSNPIKVRYFNPDISPQTVITTNWSSSSCGLVEETFLSIAGKYVLDEVSVTDWGKVGEGCVNENFKRRDDGRLCLIRRSSRLNKTSGWVIKNFAENSEETCHSPPDY
jgi:hypothetical protein